MSNPTLLAKANPTKGFFVHMITRDIELKDALLDLLDNCIDGARREIHKNSKDGQTTPYDGYWAKIVMNKYSLMIEDNCGGIPIDLATEYAFRLGRDDSDRDSDVPTVGMYGIGMKRAIFKIGKAATVVTQTDGEKPYIVKIPENWDSTESWDFQISYLDESTLDENGTRIEIQPLNSSVADQFDESNNSFSDALLEEIKTHYAYVMQKGFAIHLNNHKLEPIIPTLKLSEKGIEPYVYKASIDNVEIFLIIGFRSYMPSDELEEEEQKGSNKSHDAGWTIVCNDRVVLLNDKTHITGWGTPGVPKYHTQFIEISGIVEFSSNDAMQLPLTTTKRGIDTNSRLYSYVKNYMIEGMKLFTNYTNTWKSRKEEEKENFVGSKSYEPRPASEKIFSEKPTSISRPQNKYDPNVRVEQQRYKPDLPKPKGSTNWKIIRFTKPENEIRLLGEKFFEDADAKPSDIGIFCFEKTFSEINK